MIHMGLRISDLLNQKNISKADLARKMNKSPQSIDSMLNKASMRTDNLQAIMEVLGVNGSEVFDTDGLKNIPKKEDYVEKYNKCEEKLREYELDKRLLKNDLEHYKRQLEEKDKLVEEKERMIKVLLDKKTN